MTRSAPSVRTTLAGRLQTAVNTYHHPDTGHAITVVGTMHAATGSYYRHLSALISAAEGDGALVHYEQIRKVADAHPLTEQERHAIDLFRALSVGQRRLASFLGLMPQLAGITPRDGWVNTDMTDLDMMRALGADNAPQRVPQFEELFNSLECACCTPQWATRAVRRFLRCVLLILPWVLPLAGLRRRGWLNSAVIIDDRNQIAVTAALTAPQDRPLVMIWGAGHLPGIDRLLTGHGYVRSGSRWFTVLRGLTGGA